MRRTSQEAKALVSFIDERVLTEYSSFDLQEIVDNSPEDTEEAASQFCDRFDLGNWFYETLTLNDIDICSELINIVARKQIEEKEAAAVAAETAGCLQRSQASPV